MLTIEAKADFARNVDCAANDACIAYAIAHVATSCHAIAFERLAVWWAKADETEQYALGDTFGWAEPSNARNAITLPAALVADAVAVERAIVAALAQ